MEFLLMGAILSAFIAHAKNRNVWLWAVAGFFIPLFGVVGAFVVPAVEP